jgi:membrane associated rhomboid family serine protease
MSQLSLTLIIVIATAIISYRAFQSPAMLGKWMMIPFQVKNYREYYRLVSHAFVHGDLMHLIFNMFSLFSFGVFLEEALQILGGRAQGGANFLMIYFGGILFATLPAMYKHQENPTYRSLGASGGVSAVLMATMFLFPDLSVSFFFFIPMKSYIAIPLFFVAEHLMQRSGRTGIAHDAHIGGAIFGLLAMLAIEPQVFSNFVDIVFGSKY